MQAMTRLMAILIGIFVLTVPAEAQRPRPLGWAMDAMRTGNWDSAAILAARDGQVAAARVVGAAAEAPGAAAGRGGGGRARGHGAAGAGDARRAEGRRKRP